MKNNKSADIVYHIIKMHKLFEVAEKEGLKTINLKKHSYDLLQTLYHDGKPRELTPNQLSDESSVSSGAITNRINKLEINNLITRIPSTDDKRSFRIALTKKGISLSKKSLKIAKASQQALVEKLQEEERNILINILKLGIYKMKY